MLPPSTMSRPGTTEHEAECDRQHWVPAAGSREEDEHPADRDRRDHDHDRGRAREEPECDPGVADVVDRERAGDLHLLAERQRASDDLFRQLVGSDRGDDDRSETDPLTQSGA